MKLPKNGLIENLAEADYHAIKTHASGSILKLVADSPLHAATEMAKPSESTDAMKRGTAFHYLTLRPKNAPPPYIIAPYEEFRTDESKAWKKAQTKDVLKAKDLLVPAAMAESMAANDDFALSMRGGSRVELSAFAEIEGVACKGRIDIAPAEFTFLSDLKSVQSCSTEALIKQAWFDGWWLQASIYLRLWNRIDQELNDGQDYRGAVKFHCAEADAPHGTRTVYYRAETDIMEYGDQRLSELLAIWKHCKTTGLWPGYDPEPIEISAPGWAMKGIKNALDYAN